MNDSSPEKTKQICSVRALADVYVHSVYVLQVRLKSWAGQVVIKWGVFQNWDRLNKRYIRK